MQWVVTAMHSTYMKVREVIRLLEADGWYQVRVRGSHRQFNHPTKRGLVTVPGHSSDDLPIGTLNMQHSETGGAEEMKYLIVLERSETNFWAYSPDVPGCVSTGRTEEETMANMKEAIAFHEHLIVDRT